MPALGRGPSQRFCKSSCSGRRFLLVVAVGAGVGTGSGAGVAVAVAVAVAVTVVPFVVVTVAVAVAGGVLPTATTRAVSSTPTSTSSVSRIF